MSAATLQLKDNYLTVTENLDSSGNEPVTPGSEPVTPGSEPVNRILENSKKELSAAQQSTLMASIGEQQNRQAFLEIYEFFAPKVKSFLISKGLTSSTADDVLQEVMLAVWQKASSYDAEKAKVSTWVFTVARYKYIDRLRYEGRRPTESEDFDLHESEATVSADQVLQAQREDAVQAAIAKLPAKQQSVIFLSFLKGLSHSEIAQHLELPLGTVKSRIRRSFTQLREELGVIRLEEFGA